MRKLLILSTLFSMMVFSPPSYSEWVKVTESLDGETTLYIDYERIRKHGGFVYFWKLADYSEPDRAGNLSRMEYHQGDCELFRYKVLSGYRHEESMGIGVGEKKFIFDDEWGYPPPNSMLESVLNYVCSQ